MKPSKSNLLILVLVVVIGFLIIRGCNQSNTNTTSTLTDQRDLAKAESDTLRVDTNKDGSKEYSKDTYAVTDKDLLIAELSKKNKALAAMVQNKDKAGLRTITNTVYRDTGRTIIDTVKDTRTANIHTPYYDADIVSGPERTTLDITRMTDTVAYNIDKNYRLHAKHSNPHVDVVELESFYVKPAVRKKNWKYVVGGIIAGGLVYGVTR
jgi:hypothetical protein